MAIGLAVARGGEQPFGRRCVAGATALMRPPVDPVFRLVCHEVS